MQDVPGGALKEACRRRPLVESWSRPAGGALSLGHYQRVKVVYDETIEVVIDSHEFTPGPIGEFQDVPGGVLEEVCRNHL